MTQLFHATPISPKKYGTEKITTEEDMEKLDMFQSMFGKIDQFGWWDLERISVDAGKKFTLTEFKDECQNRGVSLTLAAPEHQEMNGQVEVTLRTLRTVAHSLMVHARVPEVYVHFTLMYTTDHIFPVIPIKDLMNKDGDPTTPHKLAFRTTHGQNKTRECETEGFVPVASLCGVVGSPSSFIRSLIGITGNM